jgi:hypothetical protein
MLVVDQQVIVQTIMAAAAAVLVRLELKALILLAQVEMGRLHLLQELLLLALVAGVVLTMAKHNQQLAPLVVLAAVVRVVRQEIPMEKREL